MNKAKEYSQQVSSLFKSSPLKQYSKNQLIHYEGDKLTSIYLVKDGYVKAYTILDSGDMRTLFILGPGDIFPIAFSSSMDWDSYNIKYFYQAMVDCELAVMGAAKFKHLIDTDPKVMKLYITYMTANNAAIMKQLEVMKNKTAISKVVMLLPYLVNKLGRRIGPNLYQLRIRLSHQEVADLSGVTRETTTTLIKKLEKLGKIKQMRGKWLIRASKDDEEELKKSVD